jgi:PAS domain S-box-containing protein
MAIGIIGSVGKSTRMNETMVPERKPIDNICAQMISVMSDMVILVNPDGMVTMTNQATLSLLGYSEKEIIDHPIQKILSISQDKQDELSSEETMGKRLLDEALANIEGFMTPKEGEPIPISLRSSAIKDCPRVVSGIVLVARDLRPTKKLIADAARAEAERRKRKELQQAYDELKQLQEWPDRCWRGSRDKQPHQRYYGLLALACKGSRERPVRQKASFDISQRL